MTLHKRHQGKVTQVITDLQNLSKFRALHVVFSLLPWLIRYVNRASMLLQIKHLFTYFGLISVLYYEKKKNFNLKNLLLCILEWHPISFDFNPQGKLFCGGVIIISKLQHLRNTFQTLAMPFKSRLHWKKRENKVKGRLTQK